MKINIITPCTRPNNLHIISSFINIPKENYRWIIVCDSDEMIDSQLIPKNCEIYTHKNPKSISGNAQRNFALDLVYEGYVYFNDDDTIPHSDLWNSVKDLNNDIISFQQIHKDGRLRLNGDVISVYHIDSHNFLTDINLIGDTRFILNKYEADGLFANECYLKSKNHIHIPKPLSVYNSLRW
jgi:hypothetical protein